MTLYWILIGFALVFLILSVPVKIRVNSAPGFEGQISWIFFKIILGTRDNDFSVSYHLFNYRLKKKAPSAKNHKKKKKKTPKKAKASPSKKREKITMDLVVELLGHTSIPKILRRCRYLLFHLIKSFSIKKLHWDISIDDYFIQGILQGMVSSLPQSKKIAIRGNFEETNIFFLKAHLSILRIFKTLFFFMITFPYLDSLKLYKKIRTIL